MSKSAAHEDQESLEQPYPPRGHGERLDRVEAPLAIIHRKTVPKNGHLEMLDHGVHHLPEGQSEETASEGTPPKPSCPRRLNQLSPPVQPP